MLLYSLDVALPQVVLNLQSHPTFRCSIFRSFLKFSMFVQDLTFFPSSLIADNGACCGEKADLAMRSCHDTITSELDSQCGQNPTTPTNCKQIIADGCPITSQHLDTFGTSGIKRHRYSCENNVWLYGNQNYLRNSQGSSAVQ